ncbi:MAG: WbqC family protein [Flavobacteriales bacterium]|nr:WbqC family protein [Flavobacteriales bacterium]MDW8431991.1 WbqC family protein [Flavobacteriales bacterium]
MGRTLVASAGMLPLAGPVGFYVQWFALPDQPIVLSSYWCNHVRIWTSQGIFVLNIPLKSQAVRHGELVPAHNTWVLFWLRTLRVAYGKAPFYDHLFPELEAILTPLVQQPLPAIALALHQLSVRWLCAGDLSTPQCAWSSFRTRDSDFCQQLLPYAPGRQVPSFAWSLFSILDLLMWRGREARIWLRSKGQDIYEESLLLGR